jgi:hypothetical protein
MGGGVEIGALLEEGGVLYGGEEEPSLRVDTLDPVSGLPTYGPLLTGATGHFYALAPSPIPTPPSLVPEPATLGLLGVGIVGLVMSRRARGALLPNIPRGLGAWRPRHSDCIRWRFVQGLGAPVGSGSVS